MTTPTQNGMYDYPSSRSPGSHRHLQQTLHRQPSQRQFDAYGQLPSGMFAVEDHGTRFDTPRFNDRMNATVHSAYGGYDIAGAQAWHTAGFGQNNSLAAIGASRSLKPQNRGGPQRSGLPNNWLDQQAHPGMPAPFTGLGSSALGPAPPLRQENFSVPDDDELIPTAIVIKNIPFAVKKEQLVQLMTDMRLPLPYAFNYHFDNGIFRGLAFANFTTAEETAAVIEAMNHFELNGRKLRVEYKKMLPLAERERIDREKRKQRGQLQEQHQPLNNPQLHSQPSLSSMSSHIPANSPSPVSGRGKLGESRRASAHFAADAASAKQPRFALTPAQEVDMNNPQSLHLYSQLLLFKEDPTRDGTTFPSTLTPAQRRIIHTLAHQMGLAHVSKGTGEQRAVHVFKLHDRPDMSPPIQQLPDSQRRGLSRAATTDFSDVRGSENFYNTLGRQGSGLLGMADGLPGNGLSAAQNLRGAKSYADLRSYTPSPVPSTASFPAALNTNFSRFNEYNGSTSSTNPSLTPTASSMAGRDEGLLVNGLGGMSLGGGLGNNGSPRGLRGMMSWENPGPIGGHRAFNANFDDGARERNQGLPARQPRGPLPERGNGFPRGRQNGHHNRGSDELSQQSGVEIVVE